MRHALEKGELNAFLCLLHADKKISLLWTHKNHLVYHPMESWGTLLLLTPLGDKAFENTMGKGEIARNEQFLLFPQCFLPIWKTFLYFSQV